MRHVLLFFLAAALTACPSTLHRILRGGPDARAATGPSIYWFGAPPIACVAPEIDEVVWPAAQAVCPVGKQPALKDRWRGLLIDWETGPFLCGERKVNGCVSVSTADVYADTPRVLIDELGHEAWFACFARSGESEGWALPDAGWYAIDDGGAWLVDAGPVQARYDPDFAGWISSVVPAAARICADGGK